MKALVNDFSFQTELWYEWNFCYCKRVVITLIITFKLNNIYILFLSLSELPIDTFWVIFTLKESKFAVTYIYFKMNFSLLSVKNFFNSIEVGLCFLRLMSKLLLRSFFLLVYWISRQNKENVIPFNQNFFVI